VNLEVIIQQPNRRARITYQSVLESLDKQLSELATEKQVDRAMGELGCQFDGEAA
jgi:hypothetical protein